MQPNNQQPSAPQPQDPYGFIFQAPQKTGTSFTPTSMKTRIIIVVSGLILLIILVAVMASLLGSAGKAQQQRYIEIAQKQTEIIRISTLAESKAKSLSARSFAVTTQLAVTSDQREMTDILAKRGINPKAQSKLLGLGQNTKTDTTLDEAEKRNRYDETLRKVLETELTNYQKLLNASAEGATASEKPILESAFRGASLLTASPEKASRSLTEGEELLDKETSITEQPDSPDIE